MRLKNLIILLGMLFAVSTPLHEISHDYSEQEVITYECHVCKNDFVASAPHKLELAEKIDFSFIDVSIFPEKFEILKRFNPRAPPLKTS
jgi:hypothetical protein